MGLTPLPDAPTIPDHPVPIHVAAVLDIQRRAAFWARLAVWASLASAVGALLLAWRGIVPWWAAAPFFLLPMIPIAAQTRIDELGEKTEDQVRAAAQTGLRKSGPGVAASSKVPPEEL